MKPASLIALIGGGSSLVLAAALAWALISKRAEVAALTSANGHLADNLAQCRANNERLEVSLDRQMAAVSVLSSARDLRAERLVSAMDSAASITNDARATAGRILQARPSGDACIAADRLILDEVR